MALYKSVYYYLSLYAREDAAAEIDGSVFLGCVYIVRYAKHREVKCADTVGTMLVPSAGLFRC